MNFIPIEFVDIVIRTNARKDCPISSWNELSGTFGERSEHIADNQIFVQLELGRQNLKVSGYLHGEPIKEMSIDEALEWEKYLAQLKINDTSRQYADYNILFDKAVSVSSHFPEVLFCQARLHCEMIQKANVSLTKLSFSHVWTVDQTTDCLNLLLVQLKSGRLEEVHQLDADILKLNKRMDIFETFFESKTCKSMFFRNGVQLSSYLPLIFELWTNMDNVSGQKILETRNGFLRIDRNNSELKKYALEYEICPEDKQTLRSGSKAVFCSCRFVLNDPKKPSITMSWFSEANFTFRCNNGHCLRCGLPCSLPCDRATQKVKETLCETQRVVFSR
ncbi:hypothetical protein L596_026925 [Steinernema carpocapsae]|uniref:Uncharacterized protein n=1 Tax=Steinernema carpocapsae TaxID=34508 RepID=A0A4U5M2Y8_STECR|nr:hypothetical protein L596_026925 [Steinernema carpocapsae]